MANGDDLDPFPVGSTYPIGGLGANDPLIDWASNLKPSDMAQFVHDPQGAVQNMINQGQPPPEHHYDSGGNPITADQAQAYDAARAKLAEGLGGAQAPAPGQIQTAPQSFTQAPIRTDSSGRIVGNVSDYLSPNPVAAAQVQGRAAAEQAARDYTNKPLGYADITTGAEIPGTPAEPKPFDWNKVIPPESPFRQRWWPTQPEKPAEAAPQPAPGTPVPRARPTEAPQPADYQPEYPAPAPGQAPEITLKRGAGKKKEDEEETPTEKALSGFSKSLAGVKMPERPKLPPLSGLSVRSPVGINPTLGALLTAAGAHAPATAGPTPLIRLIRGGY